MRFHVMEMLLLGFYGYYGFKKGWLERETMDVMFIVDGAPLSYM